LGKANHKFLRYLKSYAAKDFFAEKMVDCSLIPPIHLLNSVNFFGELTKFIGLTGNLSVR